MRVFRKFAWLLLLSPLPFLIGCASDQQVSSRPWNAPQNWESGLPSMINEGR